MNLGATMRELRWRMSISEPCLCPCCTERRGGRSPEAAEVYVFCEGCGVAVETMNGLNCGICGVEAPDRMPDDFYLGSS